MVSVEVGGTLQRSLSLEGFSDRRLLDDFRREEAVRLLGSGRDCLSDIAARPDYAGQASFNRAFSTGIRPSPGSGGVDSPPQAGYWGRSMLETSWSSPAL